MAKMKIVNTLMVGKGAELKTIGEGTEVTHLDKESANKCGIKAKEFDRLVKDGVLVENDGMHTAPAVAESKELTAATFVAFTKAMAELQPENEKHWTQDKKPEVAVLKEFGCDVTAAERDELYALYVKSNL